ncbi:MAG: hypothetical protein F4Y80_01575 [Caldilineaceae bacterium SB0665_bin_21]|nr:hypothetical protein [Caldilineaceae bacterium SB0665_bin_21]
MVGSASANGISMHAVVFRKMVADAVRVSRQTMEQPATDPACAKCGNWQHRTGTIRAADDGLGRFVNLQRFRFNIRTGECCGCVELYAARSRWGGNALDALIGD